MTYNSSKYYPWEDGGEEVILQNHVPSGALGHPFEVYYYQPGPGYGHLKFNQEGIQLAFPKGGSGAGHFLIGSLDGDADFDADDVGCLIGLLLSFGLGYLVKKARDRSRQDEFGIIWPLELKYDQLSGIEANGRTLLITSAHRRSKTFKLRAAAEDGERLYRELGLRYPRALHSQSSYWGS